MTTAERWRANLIAFLRDEYDGRTLELTNRVNDEYGYVAVDDPMGRFLLVEENTHMGTGDLLFSTHATELELERAIVAIIWEAEDPSYIVRDVIDLEEMLPLEVEVGVFVHRQLKPIDRTDAEHVDAASDWARDEQALGGQ